MPLISCIREVPRWTQLSVRKQFVERTENIPVFFEETFKKTYTEPLYVELRIDGPYCTPVGTRNEYESYIEVNALLCAAFDEKDTMKLHNLAGVIQVALSKNFCVFKLGPNEWDDKSYFEQYQLIPEDNIQLSNFGQIDPTNKIYQSTVEAHYRMRFHNGTVRP
jgi:hypothetical protein